MTNVERVADVLREHMQAEEVYRDGRAYCACGWVGEPFVRYALQTHQADMLAAAGLLAPEPGAHWCNPGCDAGCDHA